MLTQNWPVKISASAVLERYASVSSQIVPLLSFHWNLHIRFPDADRKTLCFWYIIFSVTVCWSFQSQSAVRFYAWLIFLQFLCFSLLDPTGYQAQYTHQPTEELLGVKSICNCWKSACIVCVCGRQRLLFFNKRHISACLCIRCFSPPLSTTTAAWLLNSLSRLIGILGIV